MRIYVRKWNTLKIVATSKPERNLLKHFLKKEPYIVGHSIETKNIGETEVTLELRFRKLAKPPEEQTLNLSDTILKDGTPF